MCACMPEILTPTRLSIYWISEIATTDKKTDRYMSYTAQCTYNVHILKN